MLKLGLRKKPNTHDWRIFINEFFQWIKLATKERALGLCRMFY